MKRWLRKIFLFPLSVIMAVGEGETVTTTAGAEPTTPTAEAAGTVTVTPETTSTGAEPVTPAAESVSAEAAPVEGVDTTSQEGVRTPTEGHQKTLEERVAELADKRVAELETKLTAKLQEVTQAQQLDFIPDLDFGKVNDYIRDTMAAIERAQLDGDFVKAMDLQEDLANTRKAIKENEARKAAYVERMDAQRMTEAQTAEINQRIEQASVLVAKEHGIPPELWKQGEDWFMAERRAKPLIDAQYREKVMLQGPVAALLWAKEYVEKNMGKKEEALIQQKETAKEMLPPGKSSVGMVEDQAAVKLAQLKEAARSGNPEDIAAYSKALRESRQTA